MTSKTTSLQPMHRIIDQVDPFRDETDEVSFFVSNILFVFPYSLLAYRQIRPYSFFCDRGVIKHWLIID